MVNYFEKNGKWSDSFVPPLLLSVLNSPGAMWETPTLAQMPGLRWKEHRSAGPARRAGIRRRRMNIDSVRINTSLIIVREWTIPNGWRIDRGLPQLNGQLSHLWQSLIWRQKAWLVSEEPGSLQGEPRFLEQLHVKVLWGTLVRLCCSPAGRLVPKSKLE